MSYIDRDRVDAGFNGSGVSADNLQSVSYKISYRLERTLQARVK